MNAIPTILLPPISPEGAMSLLLVFVVGAAAYAATRFLFDPRR